MVASVLDELRQKEQSLPYRYRDTVGCRVHRAISWLERAVISLEADDPDGAFIFFWISFNSIYSAEVNYRKGLRERDAFADFFNAIVALDTNQSVYNAIWKRFSDPIRSLLQNKHLFQPYWDSVNDMNSGSWQAEFEKRRGIFYHAFSSQDTETVLCILFDRLYVLRNRLIHGGAAWNSSRTRVPVWDGTRIMEFLLPILIRLVLENPDIAWQRPDYPEKAA